MSNTTSRVGPRPLALHAFAGWSAYMAAIAASTNDSAARNLLGDGPADTILAAVPGKDERTALTRATLHETQTRWTEFCNGVAQYQRHPFKRAQTRRPVIWRHGRSQLLDFAPNSTGAPILAIPSLINSSDVLDLAPRASLMRGLAKAGFRPLLLDWGAPGEDAASWSVDRYVLEKLIPALNAATETSGRTPILLGYCMGGLLAAALAALAPGRIQGLALLATPWNLHAPSPDASKNLAKLSDAFQASAAASGAVPVDILQTLFFSLDPTLALRKFRAFSKFDMESPAARAFVAMEDWVNGGPDLAAPVAKIVLEDWYAENAPFNGTWSVAGEIITPTSYRGPTLVAAPTRDRIVPHESARAYAANANHISMLEVDGGHVGMIVGRHAKRRLWRPLITWLQEFAA